MKRMRKQVFALDLKGVRSLKALHRRIAETLPVPDAYGCNFDALYDFLTEYGASFRIDVRNCSLASPTFRQVCADAVASTPGLEIVFSERGRA